MKRALCFVLMFAGCGEAVPTAPAAQPIPFQLDARGIQLLDRTQRIDFGRTDHSAIPAMTKLMGRPPSGTFECAQGGQLVLWPDGTGLVMKRGALRGWVSGELGTRAGATCITSDAVLRTT